MYPRPVVLLLVGALVVTAGCVDGLGSFDSDPTADAADRPGSDSNDATAGPDSSDGDGGDGPAGDGSAVGLVENRTAVLLEAGSYTATWQMESRTDGEVVGRTSYTTAVDYATERSSFGMLMTADGETSNDFENYYADGRVYARYGSGEEATYNVNDGTFAPENTLFPVESYISADDLEAFSVVGTETYDGVAVTRYERTERPAWLAAQSPDADVTWTQFHYAVLVDDRGLVRYESWGGEGVDDEGVTHAIEFSYSLTGVGSTTVDEPDWVGAAMEQSGQ